MSLFEKNILKFIEKHITKLLFIGILVAAVYIRIAGIEYQSSDYLGCLLPWYNDIKENGGFAALGTLTGNYNVPYQVIIAILTYIPIKPLYAYKIVSMIFDLVLAVASGLIVYDFLEKPKTASSQEEVIEIVTDKNEEIEVVKDVETVAKEVKFLVPFASILLLPTIAMNSGVWAQCDSIYTSFAVLALYFAFHKKYGRAFLFLGISFAFKLQAVLILPFFIYLYFRKKEFSILHFAIIPVVNLVLGLPALLQGLSWSEFWNVYVEQSDTYPNMFLNYPSFWVLCGDNYDTMKGIGIWLVVGILGVGLAVVLLKKIDLSQTKNYLLAAVWTVWTCLMFLPGMHERYGMLLEVLLVIQLIYHGMELIYVSTDKILLSETSGSSPINRAIRGCDCRKMLQNTIFSLIEFVIVEAADCVCYGKYLYGNYVELNIVAMWFLAAYLLFNISLIPGYREAN